MVMDVGPDYVHHTRCDGRGPRPPLAPDGLRSTGDLLLYKKKIFFLYKKKIFFFLSEKKIFFSYKKKIFFL